MAQPEDLSELVGDIYDAALDPALWPAILADIGAYVGGSAATLFWKNATDKSGDFFYESGTDRHYAQLYFDKYIKLDPLTSAHVFAEIDQPISTADLIPFAEFHQTRFYKEWVRPQGLVDFISCALDKSVASAAMIGVFRHERHGIVDDETRRRMGLVCPHVRRAVLVGKTIDLKTAEAGTFADTFDRLAAGMFLIDGAGRIVHANAAGHAMLAAGDILRVGTGCLVAIDADTDRHLRDVFAAAGKGDDAVGTRGIAVPLTARDGTRYAAHVLPLTCGARRRAGRAYTAAAAVFVHKAALDGASPPEIIARTYGLTPTELRVLLAIVEVGGVPEVAEALGVAESTVKTHLVRLYGKTGTRRQADLARLVAEFFNPLVG